MGVTFHLKVLRRGPGGTLTDAKGKNTEFSVKSGVLMELFDSLEHWKTSPTDTAKRFPWYEGSFDYEKGGAPTPSDCYPPKGVLASLQWLERELQKNAHRYPMEWTFHVPQPDGTLVKTHSFTAQHRGKPCRLFGDRQGCWAVETDTPLAYPVHYELTNLAEVPVRLLEEDRQVVVSISKRSCLTINAPMLQEIKTVCIEAMNQDGLLLPYTLL